VEVRRGDYFDLESLKRAFAGVGQADDPGRRFPPPVRFFLRPTFIAGDAQLVPLWAGGFAAEIRDDAQNLRNVHRRAGKRIKLDPAIHAAQEANRLVVEEGLPFREAYKRVAAKLKGE